MDTTMISTIAVCASMAVNIQLVVQLYLFYKELQTLKKEIGKKDAKIWKQEEEIQKLSHSNIFYCANCSKIVCR